MGITRIVRYAAVIVATVGLAIHPVNAQTLQLQPQGGFGRDAALVRLASEGVEWRRGTGLWQRAETGLVLHAHDQVRTPERTMLVLELPALAGFVYVLGGSEMAVAELRKLPGFEGAQTTTFRLNNGKAFVRLRKFNRKLSRFHVETPSGSTSVRGTEFVVAVGSDGATTVGVHQGAVQVLAQGRDVELHTGEVCTVANGNAPTTPLQLVPVPMRLTFFHAADGKAQVSGIAPVASSVFVNGLATKVGPDGSFTAEVPLAANATEIRIEVLDPTGQVETTVLHSPNTPTP